MLWGHEVSTYLCVDSLGFSRIKLKQQDTMNVNVRQQLFIQEALKEIHLQDHEEH